MHSLIKQKLNHYRLMASAGKIYVTQWVVSSRGKGGGDRAGVGASSTGMGIDAAAGWSGGGMGSARPHPANLAAGECGGGPSPPGGEGQRSVGKEDRRAG